MTCSDLIGAALLAAAEQVEYRHDTRPFLRVKGLARQTRAPPHIAHESSCTVLNV